MLQLKQIRTIIAEREGFSDNLMKSLEDAGREENLQSHNVE